MKERELSFHHKVEIFKAGAKAFTASLLDFPERKIILPELSEKEGQELDRLMLIHEQVQLEDKAPLFKEKQKEAIRKLWNSKCALCDIKDKRIGGKYSLHIHHILARRFGGKSVLENGMPLCRGCHFKAHYGMQEAFIRWRRGEKDAFAKFEKLRGQLEKEPALDREWRLYLRGKVEQRIKDVKAWQGRQKKN